MGLSGNSFDSVSPRIHTLHTHTPPPTPLERTRLVRGTRPSPDWKRIDGANFGAYFRGRNVSGKGSAGVADAPSLSAPVGPSPLEKADLPWPSALFRAAGATDRPNPPPPTVGSPTLDPSLGRRRRAKVGWGCPGTRHPFPLRAGHCSSLGLRPEAATAVSPRRDAVT